MITKQEFIQAVKTKDLVNIRLYLSATEADTEFHDESGNPPIFYAIDKETMLLFREFNANPYIKNKAHMSYISYILQAIGIQSFNTRKTPLEIVNDIKDLCNIALDFVQIFGYEDSVFNSDLSIISHFFNQVFSDYTYQKQKVDKNDETKVDEYNIIENSNYEDHTLTNAIEYKCLALAYIVESIDGKLKISNETISQLTEISLKLMQYCKLTTSMKEYINTFKKIIENNINSDNLLFALNKITEYPEQLNNPEIQSLLINVMNSSNVIEVLSKLFYADSIKNKHLLKPLFTAAMENELLRNKVRYIECVKTLLSNEKNIDEFQKNLSVYKQNLSKDIFQSICNIVNNILITKPINLDSSTKLLLLLEYCGANELSSAEIGNLIQGEYYLYDRIKKDNVKLILRTYLNNPTNQLKIEHVFNSPILNSTVKDGEIAEIILSNGVISTWLLMIYNCQNSSETLVNIFNNMNDKIHAEFKEKFSMETFILEYIFQYRVPNSSKNQDLNEEESVKRLLLISKNLPVMLDPSDLYCYPLRTDRAFRKVISKTSIASTPPSELKAPLHNWVKFMAAGEVSLHNFINALKFVDSHKKFQFCASLIKPSLNKTFSRLFNNFRNVENIIDFAEYMIMHDENPEFLEILHKIVKDTLNKPILNDDTHEGLEWVLLNLTKYGFITNQICEAVLEKFGKDIISLELKNIYSRYEDNSLKTNILFEAIGNNVTHRITPIINVIAEQYVASNLPLEAVEIEKWLINQAKTDEFNIPAHTVREAVQIINNSLSLKKKLKESFNKLSI